MAYMLHSHDVKGADCVIGLSHHEHGYWDDARCRKAMVCRTIASSEHTEFHDDIHLTWLEKPDDKKDLIDRLKQVKVEKDEVVDVPYQTEKSTVSSTTAHLNDAIRPFNSRFQHCFLHHSE